MNRLIKKSVNEKLRKNRVRATVIGTTERPRLCVRVSNLHISAQIIDDSTQKTIASVTTVGQKSLKGSMSEKADWVGTEVAKKAKTSKVKKVVFDRGSRKYHGRVKALADAARAGGLEF